jgi:MinD superfamily P-loop ATPase
MPVPAADLEKCTRCRACVDLCQFKAISILGEHLLVFPEMCHGCGGCMAVCPEGALTESRRELGEILWAKPAQASFSWAGSVSERP